MGARRQFSREFKIETVKLVIERGVAVAQVARDLDVHETRLRVWLRELTADPLQRHSMQIEINRPLYMDEATREPNAGFEPLRQNLQKVMAVVSDYVRQQLPVRG